MDKSPFGNYEPYGSEYNGAKEDYSRDDDYSDNRHDYKMGVEFQTGDFVDYKPGDYSALITGDYKNEFEQIDYKPTEFKPLKYKPLDYKAATEFNGQSDYVDYKPADHKSSEYKSGDYRPADYRTTEYKPAEYKPAEYKPSEYKPTEYKPAEYKPADYKPTEYKPTDYKPTEYKPTDYKPTEYKPTDYKPTEYKPTEYKPSDFKSSEYKPTEYKPAEYKPAEYKPVEYKAAELKPAEYKPTDYRSDFRGGESMAAARGMVEYRNNEFRGNELRQLEPVQKSVEEYKPPSGEFKATGSESSCKLSHEVKNGSGTEFGRSDYVEHAKTSTSNNAATEHTVPEDQRYNPRKVFVGGLGPHITSRSLALYFSRFGEVVDSSVVLDRVTGRSRGFGFVIFRDTVSVDKCSERVRHLIENVNCEVRRAVPREDARQQSELGARCKVFVSGLCDSTRENHLRQYFEQYGPVEEVNIKTDRVTGRSRGFAFVLFKTPEAARQSLGAHPDLGPTVEAKIAEPRTSCATKPTAATPALAPSTPATAPPNREWTAAVERRPPVYAASVYCGATPVYSAAPVYAPYPHTLVEPRQVPFTPYDSMPPAVRPRPEDWYTTTPRTYAPIPNSSQRSRTNTHRFSPY